MLRKFRMSCPFSFRRIAVAAMAIMAAVGFYLLALAASPSGKLSNPPELRAQNHTLTLTLYAALNSDGRSSFFFHGQANAPTLRLSPGDQLKITYINDLPAKPSEGCAI